MHNTVYLYKYRTYKNPFSEASGKQAMVPAAIVTIWTSVPHLSLDPELALEVT